MRADWTYKRFDEVFDLQMGKTPDRKKPQFFEGDNVWVSIRDMVGKEIDNSNEHISDSAVASTNIRKVKKGTVIMSFKLTVGKCAIATRDLYTNEAIMAFNLKDGFNISPDFLYYYLLGYKWEGANKAVMGMTLNKATISQHKIGYPHPSKQQSIVNELDQINKLIGLKKSQLSCLDSLAQSLFYDMFGDPVENDKGWVIKKMGEICTKIGSGATPRGGNESYKNEGISLIRSMNVYNNVFWYKDLAFIDEKQADALSNVMVFSQDILLNITGASVARCCIVPDDILPARVNQHVCIIRPKSIVDPVYLNYMLTNSSYQVHLLSLAKSKAATREALPKSIVENLRIPIPALPLQQIGRAHV